MNSRQVKPDRRNFLTTSSQIAAAGTVAATSMPGLVFGYHNSVNDVLKIGLVGCGGRGTAAVLNATAADSNVKVTALADAFRDRIDSCCESLTEQIPDKMAVEEDHKLTGFDCHNALCSTDVDVVLLATPPHFRPAQLKAAVDNNKHVFCEKPVGVDVPGVRSVLETCEIAREKD